MISTLKKINFLITKRQKQRLFLLATLLLFGMVMEVFGLGALLPTITIILNPDLINNNEFFQSISKIFSVEDHVTFVFYFLSLIFIIYLFKTIFLVFLTFKQLRFLNNITAYITNTLFEKYLKAPYSFFLSRNSTSLIKNLQIEVVNFQVYCTALLTIIVEGALIFAVIGTLIYIEPLGAIFLGLFFGILSYLFHSFFKAKVKEWGFYREQLDKKISKVVIESLSVIKDLKVLNKEDFFIDSNSRMNYNKSRINSNHSTIIQLPRFYLELVSIVGLISFIFFMLLKGENPYSLISTLGIFAAATFRIIPSINKILGGLQNLKYYNKSIDLLFTEMQIEPEIVEDKRLSVDFKSEIVFKNICFKYLTNSEFIFKSLNFEIKKGQTIGLIGSSGSGKSTFIDILIGLLIPTRGSIIIDGQPLTKFNSSWKRKIGYISQDIHLIDDSIMSNIALGVEKEKIDKNLLDNAINLAQLDTFIKKLPKGIDTLVGDKGVQISGGQKQRIGLARALYYNPEILILDEATSSLDNKTEKEVMRSIEMISDNKTIIIIAHRLSTLGFCDHIYELKDSIFKEIKL